jgi:hypothetical protein
MSAREAGRLTCGGPQLPAEAAILTRIGPLTIANLREFTGNKVYALRAKAGQTGPEASGAMALKVTLAVNAPCAEHQKAPKEESGNQDSRPSRP